MNVLELEGRPEPPVKERDLERLNSLISGLTPGAVRLLDGVVRVPLINTQGPKGVYDLVPDYTPATLRHQMRVLQSARLVEEARAFVHPWGCFRLMYPTASGVAAAAYLAGSEPQAFASEFGADTRGLRARVAGVSRTVGVNMLVAALASQRPGAPSVECLQMPFRGRRKTSPSVALVSGVSLQTGASRSEYLLLSDFGDVPLSYYEQDLLSLMAYRREFGSLPPLVIGSEKAHHRWESFLNMLQGSPSGTPFAYIVVSTAMLSEGIEFLPPTTSDIHVFGRREGVDSPYGGGLPRTGVPLNLVSAGQLNSEGVRALGAIGAHPWLSVSELSRVLGLGRVGARRLVLMLERAGFLISSKPKAAGPVPLRGRPNADNRQLELTRAGMRVYASQIGALPERRQAGGRHYGPPDVVYLCGLSGGGESESFGERTRLASQHAHTLAVNGLAMSFFDAADNLAGCRVSAWKSAKLATVGSFRPDTYLELERGGKTLGFFVELDRDTERGSRLDAKVAAWFEFARTPSSHRMYSRFPTMLFVSDSERQLETFERFYQRRRQLTGLPLPLLTALHNDVSGERALLGSAWSRPGEGDRVCCLGELIDRS